MNTLFNWLTAPLIWFIIGLILLLLEFAMPGLVTVFFGIGAWVVAIICLFIDIPINLQLVIFLLASMVSLLALRRWLKENLFRNRYASSEIEEQELAEFIGQRAVVTRTITPETKGRVEFHGTYWDAEAYETIPEGAPVEIIDKKNITLIVNSIKQEV
jgi:membrane protein implicated in regulation of membrane protease activity